MTEATETPVEAPAAEMPAWFDAEVHIHTYNGIYERDTGLFLADDGLPHAGMARCTRLVEAGVAEDPLGLVDAGSIAATASHLAAMAAQLAAEAARTKAEDDAAKFIADKAASIAKGARRTSERFAVNTGDAGSGAAAAQED